MLKVDWIFFVWIFSLDNKEISFISSFKIDTSKRCQNVIPE